MHVSRTTVFLLLLLIIIATLAPPAHAQQAGSATTDLAPWGGRARYPEGVLALKAGAGLSKYLGEFTDHTTASHYALSAQYSIFPELTIGASAMVGDLTWLRRDKKGLTDLVAYQFADGRNMVPSSSWFSSYNLELALHFFPRQVLDAYVLGGAGVTLYYPDDYAASSTTVMPKTDKLASITFPVGLGTDVFLTRQLSLNLEWRVHFMMNDNLDAFPVADVERAMRPAAGAPAEASREQLPSAMNGYSLLTFGARYFLFENGDLDGDLLPNSREEQLGTNPYEPDTDGDGLTDFEEVVTYLTDPRRTDSDSDGLNDYVEVVKYRSNPQLADTDGDGLTDAQEVLDYRTNVIEADTDADGLADGEEIALGTNPREVDTDKDDLSDGEEVRSAKTDPLARDTDGDGLSDYEEVRAYFTDARKADSDGDGLTDFEEVAQLMTSPLKTDTDGDGLADYAEVRTLGTHPLRRDSDGDGIPDAIDKCPNAPETRNGVDDGDGCPDDGLRSAPDASQFAQLAAMSGAAGRDTLLRVDTVVVREGGVFTLFGVNFEVAKAVLRPESMPILDMNAKLFAMYPELRVEVRGHTDSDGDEALNEELSLRRAQTVADYLVAQGIAREKITVKGFGESAPIVSNNTAIGKARNRRIEFFIVHRGPRSGARELITGDPAMFE